MEIISTKIGIDPLWSRVTEAIRSEIRIAPGAYDQLAQGGYAPGGGASDNWDEVACAIDVLNIVKRQPSTVALPVLAGFLRAKLDNKKWMQKEFGAWVYIHLHVEPTILQYACALEFAKADPATWQPLADGLRGWLRALVGWLAVTGCWGPGKSWFDAENKAGPGARLFVGRGAYSGREGGAPHCTLAGKRSWDWLGENWYEGFRPTIILASLGLGDRAHASDVWREHKQFLAATEGMMGHPLDVLGADERALVLAATRNDLGALGWCVTELIRDWLPSESVVIVRAEHGVSCTLLEAGKSSTATVYHSGWADDGTTYVAGADPGWRGGHAEGIEPGIAEIDLATRTGWCKRTQGDPIVRVQFPLPQGPLVAVIEAQHGVGIRMRSYRGGVEVGPTPPPAPPTPPVTPPAKSPGETGGGCALFLAIPPLVALVWAMV